MKMNSHFKSKKNPVYCILFKFTNHFKNKIEIKIKNKIYKLIFIFNINSKASKTYDYSPTATKN